MSLRAQSEPIKASPAKTLASQPDPFEVNRRIRRSGLSYAAQALLGAILDHDRYGRSPMGCIASLETLAADIDATPQYVSKLLPALLDGGWIVAGPFDGRVRPLRMGEACSSQQSEGAAPNNHPVSSQQSSAQLPTIVGCKRSEERGRGNQDSLAPPESNPEILRGPWPATPPEPLPAPVASPQAPPAGSPSPSPRMPVPAGTAFHLAGLHTATAVTLAGLGWLLRPDWTIVAHPGSSERRPIPDRLKPDIDEGRRLHARL